ncbi:hypothetical protein SAMN05444000_10435 [Shimia gijangensis]|uniref:Uncharacterized protein n=1 Tax=Shimia gijangensis TaxID=1470563 RepID=A0A1M6FCI5_9RHOB|nr:hypothetical protein [Shimia gijangensis]SHI95387.1 hypothetical protein SAMN05444000_10435 [Shimia gijangensis]
MIRWLAAAFLTLGSAAQSDPLGANDYASNAFPPAEPVDLKNRFASLVAQSRDQITQCYPGGAMVEYAEAFLGSEAEALFAAALAKPRLPVTQPCL